MFLLQLPVQCCAAVMASTLAVVVSVIVGGKALSVMFQTTNASTSTVEDTESALWGPACAILVIKEITARKVRIVSSGFLCSFWLLTLLCVMFNH